MKRKDVEEANNDFFDFTLSSPALKIRRLDAELAPIIDEEESMKPELFRQSVPFEDTFVEEPVVGSSPITIEELSSVPGNEERAIVLFNPKFNTPSLQSTPPFSFSIDSDFISGFKNPVIWSNRSSAPKSLADETQKQDDDNSEPTHGCLAVVPWVPSHSQHPPTPEPEAEVPGAIAHEMMDADAMDVEDDCNSMQIPKAEYGSTSVREGSNQWQQNRMIPHPPNHLVW